MKIFTQSLVLLTILLSATLGATAQDEKFTLNEVDKNGNVTFRRYDEQAGALPPLAKEKGLLKSLLHIGDRDSLGLVSAVNDDIGYTHKFYQQYYNGIKVEGATYAVHSKNGSIITLNGEFAKVGSPDLKATIHEEEALQSALKFIGASLYKWQVPAEEASLQQAQGNSRATYLPKGELLIIYDYLQTKTYRLAYKFAISSYLPPSSNYIYVDAITGKVVAKQNMMFDVNVPATGSTRYSGTQPMTTDQFVSGTTNYRLREVRGGSNVPIQTFNSQRVQSTAQVDFTDPTNAWTSLNNANMDNVAIDAHWASELIYDYWLNTRGRNSYNGTGAALISFVHYNIPYQILNGVPQYHTGIDNAAWDGTAHQVVLGDGYTHCNPLASFDAVSHEFAHGYTEGAQAAQFAAGGILRNADGAHPQALALNEGISDIWAAVTESLKTNYKQTWLIGEEVMKNGKPCLRSLVNPKTGGDGTLSATGGYPDTYMSTYWDNANEPHTNSTVLSHWFYLLCNGGTGTNGIGNAYKVLPISIASAASIVWRAEQNYFGPNTDYNGARTALINAATDLFGACSNELVQVTNAWYAVGLGAWIANYTIGGPSVICGTGQYTLTGQPAGSNITWSTNPTGIVNVPVSGNPITAGKVSSGSTTIIATVNGCYSTFFNVSTVPAITSVTASMNGTCRAGGYQDWYLSATANLPITSWQWTNDNSSVYMNIYNPTSSSTYVTVHGGGGISITAKDQCNETLKDGVTIYSPCNSFVYSVSPNPASSSVRISAVSDEVKVSSSIVKVQIVDKTGILQKQLSFGSDTKETTINVSALKPDVYILKIYDGKSWHNQQIIIKR